MPLKIAYLGNFRHEHCTEVHLARELQRLGHDVLKIQEPPGGVEESEYSGYAALLRQKVGLRTDEQVDAFMWTRTWGLPKAASLLWIEFETAGITTFSYHLDLYVGLERQTRVNDDPFWSTAYVFTPDGDPKSQLWFEEHGINHHFMPPAVVSDECYLGTPRADFAHDIVFVGSHPDHYHPEHRHRAELFAFLELRYGDRFHYYGRGARVAQVRNRELNDLYASAKVVIGDSLYLPGRTHYTSDRVFETMGRGGFLLYPRTTMTEFLDLEMGLDDTRLRWYYPGDWSQLDRQIGHFLESYEHRVEIQHAGHEYVKTHHTYKHRLRQALIEMGFNDDV